MGQVQKDRVFLPAHNFFFFCLPLSSISTIRHTHKKNLKKVSILQVAEGHKLRRELTRDTHTHESREERLQQSATTRALFLLGEEDAFHGLIEHRLEILASLGRTLDILVGLNLLGKRLALFRGDGSLARTLQLLNRSRIIAKIDLGADQDLRDIGTEVDHFRVPLITN